MKSVVIDFGNTNRKLAVFDNGSMIRMEQFREAGLEQVEKFSASVPDAGHCILASVVNYPAEIREFLSKRFRFIELNENTPVPVVIEYRDRHTLGSDRLAAAVAGSTQFPNQDVLMINAGTCITYDFVDAAGRYLGGSISPGIGMRFKALHTFTDKLPLLSISDDLPLTGSGTHESIRSGVLHGATAEIEGIVARYRDRYPGLQVILSGGDHNYFIKWLKISIFAIPNSVLIGLQKILEFNVSKA